MNPPKLLILFCAFAAAGPAFAKSKMDTAVAAKQIDAILAADWKKNNLQGNPAVDDATFVRRLYLDVIGRIPTTRETEEFMASKDANKRAKLIDKLIASEGYVQHAFNYFADILRAQSNGPQAGQVTGAAYTNFVKQSLRDNKPYDQFVRELVASQGKAWDNGAIGYYMRDRGMPLDNMANTVRIFLGTRIECSQCHNHPFDKWTQMQFYQMASFTYGQQTQDYGNDGTMEGVRDLLREREKAAAAKIVEPKRPQKTKETTGEQYAAAMKQYDKDMQQVKAKRREVQNDMQKQQRFFNRPMTDIRDTMRYTTVSYREDRSPRLPHDYKYEDAKPNSTVKPGVMFGHCDEIKNGDTALDAYARWMTQGNERFNSVTANRLWKRAFGLALIEPLDELLDNTVPMVPELQKNLEKLIVDVGYDMKSFMRILYNTRAYQSQVTKHEVAPGMVYHFTGPVLRRMSAEQMWDSFVALINPNPDMPNEVARQAMEQRVLQSKKTFDSINALEPEKVLAALEVAAKKYEGQASAVEKQQKLIAEAREKAKDLADGAKKLTGDAKAKAETDVEEAKKVAKQLSRELNELYSDARKAVVTGVFIPGQKALYQKVTGKPFQTAMLKTDGDDKPASYSGGDMMMAVANSKERVMIPGYDKAELTKEDRQAQEEARRKSYAEEAAYYGIPEKEQRYYFRSREDQIRNWLRSAEIESPAPRGHYLREFGQSDRETIENSNNEASVPQALAMMNGQLLPQIMGQFSQLMLTIRKAQYPDDKVEAAYMTILGRKPTAKEKQLWLASQEKGLSSMEDLVFALLNTQQFIFIQ